MISRQMSGGGRGHESAVMKANVVKPATGFLLQPPWNGMTLPGLLSGAATLRADAPFLVDAENVEPLAHRPQCKLSCSSLKGEVERFARQMLSLGLHPGEVVILHLPNTTEAVIALLGVQAAGGIPAPAPIFDDVEALRAFIELTNAAAMVSMGVFAGLHLAEKCREAAATSLSVRFLAATGNDLPGGVIGLDDWGDDDFDENTPLPALKGNAPALITFDKATGMRRALLRTHEQIIADAATAAALTRAHVGSRLLVTIPPSTIAGVVYAVALPLLSGAVVELTALFDSCSFIAQLDDGVSTAVVLPACSETAFLATCAMRSIRVESLVLVHRPDTGATLPVFSASSLDIRMADAICLGEGVLSLAVRAKAETFACLPQRAIHPVPGLMLANTVQLELALGANGTLHASGPLAPQVYAGASPKKAASPRNPGRLTTGFSGSLQNGDSIRLGPASAAMESAA